MSYNIIKNFNSNLVTYLSFDEYLKKLGCKIFVTSRRNQTYPFIIVNIEKIKKLNFETNIYEIEGVISIFSNDKLKNNIYDIITRVDNILERWQYPALEHILISIRLGESKFYCSEDNLSIKLENKFHSLIRQEL